MKARVQAEPSTSWGAHVLFADAALVGLTVSLLVYTCRWGACVCFSAPVG